MGTHAQHNHFDTDQFSVDGSGNVTLTARTKGGGRLTNTPEPETTLAGTKYKVPGTWSNGTSHEITIDNTNFGFKYTGTANKTILFMASMGASSDTNATECEWELYKNTSATGIKMKRYFDKQNKGGAFTLLGRVDVSENDTIFIHVSSDVAGAKILHNTINVEIMQE